MKGVEQLRRSTPREWKCKPSLLSGEECPFCQGHEGDTPREVYAYRQAGSGENNPGWWVRTVPNLGSAVASDIPTELIQDKPAGAYYRIMPGYGHHNVVIETARHDQSLASVSQNQCREVVNMWRDLAIAVKAQKQAKHGLIYKNHGPLAGASQPHSHSQQLDLPIPFPRVVTELNGAYRYYHEGKMGCPYCKEIQWELEAQERMIARTERFLAWCPFASETPYRIVISPIAHSSDFSDISNFVVQGQKDELSEFSELLQNVLMRMNIALNDPDYLLFLHTAPTDKPRLPYYHWHFHIKPITTAIAAGCEEGGSTFMVPRPPEEAANDLRSVKLAAA